jgi:hypothetical protein
MGPPKVSDQGEQSTATERAVHICRIRTSPSRPRRSTRTATDTLSIESRFTAERRGTGSSLGSRTTSLARPRIVVVHGATTARRSRGIAASRDKTTTGRLPAFASSHHQISPRAGIGVTWRLPLGEIRPGCPTHRARRADVCRSLRSSRQFQRIDDGQAAPQELHRSARRRSVRNAPGVHSPKGPRSLSCSPVCESCHEYATDLPNPDSPAALSTTGRGRASAPPPAPPGSGRTTAGTRGCGRPAR